MIPPEEGGDDRAQRPGTTSAAFEGEGQFGGQQEQKTRRLAENPGGFDADPRGVDQPRRKEFNEKAPRTEDQALQEDQEGTARSYAHNA